MKFIKINDTLRNDNFINDLFYIKGQKNNIPLTFGYKKS